jgi:hypothetical protein
MRFAIRSGALHAACVAARVFHHSGITRCGCSNSSDVRIKSAASPVSNYAPMIRSCNGLLQHFFDCCVPATSIAASESMRRDLIPRALARWMWFEEVVAARDVSIVDDDRTGSSAIAVMPRGAAWLDRCNPRGIPPWTLRGLVEPLPGSRPALQNSVELRKFRASAQPPVREAGVRSAAVAQTRPPRDGAAVTREALGAVGVRA